MGLGVAGAMIDVSASVAFVNPISRAWGKRDEFRDVVPGVFSFTLDNYDGRYTPDNPASTLATPLTEGVPVSWLSGTRLVSGTVLGIEMSGDESAWGEIRVTCDDMLGAAARRRLTLLMESAILGSGAVAYWPFSDDVSSTVALEQSGYLQPRVEQLQLGSSGTYTAAFGVAALAAVGLTQLSLSCASSLSNAVSFGTLSSFNAITYGASTMGSWGLWVTPTTATSYTTMAFRHAGYLFQIIANAASGFYEFYAGPSGPTFSLITSVPFRANVPHLVSFSTAITGGTTVTTSCYIDGTLCGTMVDSTTFAGGITAAQKQPKQWSASIDGSVGACTANFSSLYHTPTAYSGPFADVTTEAGQLTILGQTEPKAVLGALPGDLSSARIGNNISGGSTLDALLNIIRTEQGHIYTSTAGSLLAPVQTITVRARQRPATPTYTLDVAADVSDVPQFIRDITNMTSAVTATGVGNVARVVDPTIVTRAAGSNIAETVLNTQIQDLRYWAQDRLVRGKNINLRVASLTVDALTVSAATSAILLALKPGDRIQMTGLPSVQLGFTTWDGWLIGASESHSIRSHTFVLFLAPVVREAVTDTDRLMADGVLTLSGALTSVATSVSIATSSVQLDTSSLPYTLLIDREQVTMTACTTGSPQVATITRAINSTLAAAHSSGAVVEISPPALCGF